MFENYFYSILTTFMQINLESWTNFSQQDLTWAEFSTLEVAACIMSCAYHAVLQNSLT